MKEKRIHFGYFVVATMIIMCFIPLSLGLSCAGIFYPSVSESLGVEKGMLSYYTSFIWAAALITLPFLGRLLNTKDARVCLTGAVVLVVIAFLWLSQMHALWQFYLAAFMMGIAIAMLLFLAPSTLINRWFAKRAGAMLGIAVAFTGVGGVIWSTVGGILISEIGWSQTYLVFAVLSACTIPATLFMVRSYPSDKGLLPFGANKEEQASQAESEGVPSTPHLLGIEASRAYRMPVFFLILAFCFFLNIAMYVYFMIPSYATTLDVGAALPLLGATASSVAMAGQTISKVTLGVVGERFPQAGTVAALACGIVGVALFAFFPESAPSYYVAALLFGLYYGITNVMMPLLTRRAFGDKDYAPIYSKVSMVASISNGVAALIWGTIIDASGSYMPLFIGSIVLMVLSIICVIAICRSKTAAQVQAQEG